MSVLVPGRNLVLAGLMGTGKTTVGRSVADRLGRPFVDTDAMVEKETGRSVAQVFEEEGERAFRDYEAVAVRTVSAVRGQVIAVGGGALERPSNVTSLRGTGDIVVLDAAPETLARRVAAEAGARPLLAAAADPIARLSELRAQRQPAYLKAAAVVIDTDGRTPDEVADAVLQWARVRAGLLVREERAIAQ